MTYTNPENWEDPTPEVEFNDPWIPEGEPIFIDRGSDADWLKHTEPYEEPTDEEVAEIVEQIAESVLAGESSEVALSVQPFAEEVRVTITRLNVCPKCGNVIEPTGKKGRPRKTHKVCPTETEGL